MSQYYAIITDVGNAKISNALALGRTISLTHMAVGDANGNNFLPTPEQKKLVNEKFRAQINSLTIDDDNQNIVIAEFIIPEDVGGFYVRELGVFDNEGNLIAVGNTPESYKPKMTEGSGAQKVMRMHLVTSASDKIELKINPSIVVATIDLVNKKVDEINKTIATKADKNHNHDTIYAPKTHTHDYSLTSHNHDTVYAPKTHNHDAIYAPKTHTHDYAAPNHTHTDLSKTDASNISVASYLTKLGLKEASLTANGWCRLPSGLIFQWGYFFVENVPAASGGTTYSTITFPIAFPNEAFTMVALGEELEFFEAAEVSISIHKITKTQCNFNFLRLYGSGSEKFKVNFLSIGY